MRTNADCDPRGRLLERGELARLRRGLAAGPSAVLHHHGHRADQEWHADRQLDVRGGDELDAIHGGAVGAADILDRDLGSEQEVRVVARDRAGIDHPVALAGAADGLGAGTR
jgi:hypothetical protein